jgi:hypothetical protein
VVRRQERKEHQLLESRGASAIVLKEEERAGIQL